MKYLRPVSVALGIMPTLAAAQDAEPGGVYFQLDVEQSMEASTDFDLTTEEEESGFEGVTALDFLAVTETRSQTLSFGLSTDVRVADGDVTRDETLLTLAYERESANAMLDFSVTGSRTDIAFLRDITDFIDDEGVIVLPDDLDELTGTGIRNTTTFAGSLEWGINDPIGYSLGLNHEVLRYEDASDSLLDSDTTTVEAGTRLDFNEVTTGDLTLGFTRSEEGDEDPDESATLTAAVTIDRPLGALTTRLSATRTAEDETFLLIAVDRVLDVPGGTFETTLGVAEDDFGDGQLFAELEYSTPLPAGEFDIALASLVGAGDDGRTTTFQASYSQDLNDVSGVRLGIDAGQVESFEDGGSLTTGGVSASYAIALTSTWDMDVGARRDIREEDGETSASSTIFLTLERAISWRP